MGQPQRLRFIPDEPFTAWRHGHVGLLRQLAGFIFIPEEPHGFMRRTDELDVALPANFREVGVFRKETVARVNGFNVGNFSSADETIDLKVTIRGGRRAYADRLVS